MDCSRYSSVVESDPALKWTGSHWGEHSEVTAWLQSKDTWFRTQQLIDVSFSSMPEAELCKWRTATANMAGMR
ncbi:uncharacterized protein CIMG_09078 [Coccidioides immitis RS]|uniref:Uncharacterized protein n=1 Tax=Coccidioides immitis (strain RS) TaxID=246410 RepID=A0A0E1RVS6_COCIM|nr:uncharacterized protein CIMG_09078 [Coccidioides immitis RS]EAS27874.2 hypothetical protein CIMG_09078 [Coccidioides immitis RS]